MNKKVKSELNHTRKGANMLYLCCGERYKSKTLLLTNGLGSALSHVREPGSTHSGSGGETVCMCCLVRGQQEIQL